MANQEHLKILGKGVEAWNEWRKENTDRPDLGGADLTGANLRRADLSDANLHDAHLRHARDAHLIEADLSDANLRRAGLRRADLRRANLRGADLRRANLSDANLRGADLIRANLSDANLARANLSGSWMGFTSLGDLDLSEAKGLDQVNQRDASSIGTDTLYRSRGKIPEVFLRGCGVPENLLVYLPSLVAPSAIDFYSCFISDSHEDKSFARRLHDR